MICILTFCTGAYILTNTHHSAIHIHFLLEHLEVLIWNKTQWRTNNVCEVIVAQNNDSTNYEQKRLNAAPKQPLICTAVIQYVWISTPVFKFSDIMTGREELYNCTGECVWLIKASLGSSPIISSLGWRSWVNMKHENQLILLHLKKWYIF